MAISGSASSGTVEAITTSDSPSTSEITTTPEPSSKPLIATATISEDRVQHPRLVRKPRTPPAPRRHMPSSAPPVVELPPAVEDMSGGKCTEDNVNEGNQHAPLDALVERVVDEVSRRVLERFASAPYMVGLSENAVCEYVMKQDRLQDVKHDGYEPQMLSHINLRNRDQCKLHDSLAPVPITSSCASFNNSTCKTQNTRNFLHRLYLGIFGLLLGFLDWSRCFGIGEPWHFRVWESFGEQKIVRASGHQSSTSEGTKLPKQNTAAITHLRRDERERPDASVSIAAACDGEHLVSKIRKGSCLRFWSFSSRLWLYSVEGFQKWGVRLNARASCKTVGGKFISSNMQTSSDETPAIKNKNTKTFDKKVPATSQLKSGDRKQNVAATSVTPMLDATSSDASGFDHQWLILIVCSLPLWLDGTVDLPFAVLQGGMLSQHPDVRISVSGSQQQYCPTSGIIPLEECASNILIGDCVNIDNVRALLDHPEAPWVSTGDGFQIILGAARLSLTTASNAFPNFTRVMNAYMQQCNNKAQGSTLAINKNLKTSMHIDSRNEKLPAYLTAITDYGDGEIFLKSEHGDKSFEGCKGFLVPIPVGCTLDVPTFKIPHATNHWTGNRIIMVMFTTPIKRIEASKNNLRLQLQHLGFCIPEIDKRWIDCEITGNSYGIPVYSKPASIRGYFDTGVRRHAASDEKSGFGFGVTNSEVWDISSESDFEATHDHTRRWTDPFDTQISDIEQCPDDVRSPATTILDEDSELQTSKFNDEDIADADAVCRKRKNISPERTPENRLQHAGDRRRSINYHASWLGCDRTSSRLRFISDGLGDRSDNIPNDTSRFDCDISHSRYSSIDRFGFNDSRAASWSVQSDPIEPCTDDDISRILRGGGAPADEFQPNKADISKMVQKLKNVPHGYAPKQIRMLLISDTKFCKKIERTTDVKQLQSCVAAAAQRMGLSGSVQNTQKNAIVNDVATSNQRKRDDHPSSTVDGKAASGKGGLTASQKGKGHGNPQKHEPKGQGKGKIFNEVHAQKQHGPDSTKGKGKAKGKGKHNNITYSIDPDGWNVRPLTEFSNTHGGIYMCEKEEQAKHIAEKGVGRNYPIGVLAPFPMDIGVKQPESICVEFIKHFGDQSHKISMQAFLHQITYADVEYRKMAPAVTIQKPSIAKTSVCYLTFSDSGACAQTQIEIEQKKIPSVKQWISSLVQHNRSLEILDVWNVQALQKQVTERIYQVSVRVPSAQVESLLAMSGPGNLQVNVPGALRMNLQHIWLKKDGKPMTEDEVLDIMEENRGKHLGAFQVRGTWARRMLTEHHNEMKAKLGKNEEPAYFISNVPPEMEAENVQEILQQLKWKATVKEGERRWKRAGYTWLVRSGEDPRVWQFPITFGYERRTLKIEAARKPKVALTPPAAINSVMHFPTWNAQCRIGKLQQHNNQSQPTFAEIVTNAARKRHRPEVAPIRREDSENWSDIEEDAAKRSSSNLQQQLNDMMKQNSEQQ